MDVGEFLRRYEDGERDFSGIEIRDADLSGIDLYDKVILRKAKLININLSNSNLSKADLSEADLTGSNLNNAFLWKANLTNANLSNTNLFYANLEAANLRNAILTSTDLSCTDLIGADLTGTNIEAALNLASHYIFLVDESKNKNTELLTELRNLTRGLNYRYNSEGSYYYEIFLWDTASRGDFSLEKFLEAAVFLVEVDSIDLFEGKFYIDEFNFILKDIKQYIKNREYFYLKLDIGLFDSEPIPVLIGNTQAGDWIGICPLFDIKRGGEEEIGRIQDNASHKIEYEPLISALKNLETVKIFNSALINSEPLGIFHQELDCTVEGVAWEIAENRNNLLHNLLKYSKMMHFYDDGDFGGEGFFGENDEDIKKDYPEEYKRIQRLSNIIKTRFKDIKIYWIGDGEIDVYIVGKIETGDWIGIRSRLSHT